jgi:hypothetical protein
MATAKPLSHTNQSKAAMQNTAKTASPPIMVNISSSQLDVSKLACIIVHERTS